MSKLDELKAIHAKKLGAHSAALDAFIEHNADHIMNRRPWSEQSPEGKRAQVAADAMYKEVKQALHELELAEKAEAAE